MESFCNTSVVVVDYWNVPFSMDMDIGHIGHTTFMLARISYWLIFSFRFLLHSFIQCQSIFMSATSSSAHVAVGPAAPERTASDCGNTVGDMIDVERDVCDRYVNCGCNGKSINKSLGPPRSTRCAFILKSFVVFGWARKASRMERMDDGKRAATFPRFQVSIYNFVAFFCSAVVSKVGLESWCLYCMDSTLHILYWQKLRSYDCERTK